MHAALFSHRGCLQVLFLGILGRHVQSVTLQLQREVSATCLTGVIYVSSALRIKKRLLHRRKSDGDISYIDCVRTPLLQTLDGRFLPVRPLRQTDEILDYSTYPSKTAGCREAPNHFLQATPAIDRSMVAALHTSFALKQLREFADPRATPASRPLELLRRPWALITVEAPRR